MSKPGSRTGSHSKLDGSQMAWVTSVPNSVRRRECDGKWMCPDLIGFNVRHHVKQLAKGIMSYSCKLTRPALHLNAGARSSVFAS